MLWACYAITLWSVTGSTANRRLHAAALVALALAAGAVTAVFVVPPGRSSGQATATVTDPAAHSSRIHNRGDRVGGVVRRAWPTTGAAPHRRQTRWLARQVGAIKPRRCARQRSKARVRCHLKAQRSSAQPGAAPPATLSAVTGDPGSPRGEVVQIAAASALDMSGIKLPLQLVRSYEMPADDPAYKRLLNWSWTYDSAITAAAFASSGDKANSTQLLDQLAALQYSDGSLEIAFNTITGEGARIFRTGTVAWAGLAAATYDRAFDSSRYLDTERRTADYLLSLQRNTGLIPGGPDVKWVSTQHNLITYVLLVRLAKELEGSGDAKAAAAYRADAKIIGASIDENLFIDDKDGARFLQGVADTTQAVDVQALGALYLQGTGRPEAAARVLEYALKTFAVADRSIRLSSDPDTYNLSYEAKGHYAGFAPYAGTGQPNVLWGEATPQLRLAQAALGQDTKALDKSIDRWASITDGAGPLQADQATTGEAGSTEYHVWPAATAAAWTVLAQSAPAFFAAPLGTTTELVTEWAEIRGGNLIKTYNDGGVLLKGGAERRIIAGSERATDYTATSIATQASDGNHGVYVRATVDSATKLTAYCVQLDKNYGNKVVVRQILGDVELAVPIATAAVPSGFTWYDTPHEIGVTVTGNTMNVTLDKAQLINVPDLAAQSAKSVNYTYPGKTMSPPLAGGYGLRAWGNGAVALQQMTVTTG